MEKFENIQPSRSDVYVVPDLATLFHDFPRINILTFLRVSSSFDLQVVDSRLSANQYSLGLLFYPACCALLLILSVLITGIVSCCMCCKPPQESKNGGLKCMKFFISAIALFIAASCVIGSYGNHQCGLGVRDLQDSSNNISLHVESIKTEVSNTEDDLKKLTESLNILKASYDYTANQLRPNDNTALERVKEVDKAVDQVIVLEDQLSKSQSWKIFNHQSDMEIIDALLVQVEFIRNVSTWSLLGWCFLIAFIILLSVMCNSEVFLMVGAVMGIFGLMTAFSLASWNLLFALGVSDFCVDPHDVIYNQTEFRQDDISYFLQCPDDEQKNPHYSDLQNAFQQFNEGNKTLKELYDAQTGKPEVLELIYKLVFSDMQGVYNTLEEVKKKSECDVVYANYVSGLNSICYTFLEGVDFLLGAGLIIAVLLFIVIIMAACTWGQMEKQLDYMNGSFDHLEDPYRRTSSRHHDNGRYGMFAASSNYARLGPAAASRGDHPPPPSYHI